MRWVDWRPGMARSERQLGPPGRPPPPFECVLAPVGRRGLRVELMCRLGG
jgi:hypothetical protein